MIPHAAASLAQSARGLRHGEGGKVMIVRCERESEPEGQQDSQKFEMIRAHSFLVSNDYLNQECNMPF